MLTAPRGKARTLARNRACSALGCTPKTLDNKISAWRKANWDWRLFVDRRRFPAPGTKGQPRQFVDWCKALVLEHQRERTMKRAWKIVVARYHAWRAGDETQAIPGFAAPPPPLRNTGLPLGWDYKNFTRFAAAGKFQKALIRQGEKAAAPYVPQNRTTRVGIEPGRIWTLDDQDYDVYVSFVGSQGAGTFRPSGFDCSDFASDMTIASMAKPRLLREDGSLERLSEVDFMWFVHFLLVEIGLHPAGTIAEVEHGTAAIRGPFKDALDRILGEKFRIATGGKYGTKPAIPGMGYRAAVSGNFKFKARRESAFNLLRNAHAALPGATGLDRHHAPEENEGLLRAQRQFTKLLLTLPEERALLLKSPLLEWHQFNQLILHVRMMLMNDPDHALEGWERSGFTVQEFTIDGERWLPFAEIERMRERDPAQAAAVEALALRPGCNRIRRLSRAEAWARRPRLEKIPDALWPLLLPPEMSLDLRVGDSLEFVHKNQFIDADPLVYVAQAIDERGRRITLRRGETYRCYLNPLFPNRMVVCEAHGTRAGAFIGTVERTYIPSRLDHEAIWRNQGRINNLRADEAALAELSMRGRIAYRQSNHDFNARVADTSKPLTAREKAAAAQFDEAAILPAPAPAAPEPFDPSTLDF